MRVMRCCGCGREREREREIPLRCPGTAIESRGRQQIHPSASTATGPTNLPTRFSYARSFLATSFPPDLWPASAWVGARRRPIAAVCLSPGWQKAGDDERSKIHSTPDRTLLPRRCARRGIPAAGCPPACLRTKRPCGFCLCARGPDHTRPSERDRRDVYGGAAVRTYQQPRTTGATAIPTAPNRSRNRNHPSSGIRDISGPVWCGALPAAVSCRVASTRVLRIARLRLRGGWFGGSAAWMEYGSAS